MKNITFLPEEISNKMIRCPPCVQPCIPKPLQSLVNSTYVKFRDCKPETCRGKKPEADFCIPPHLRYLIPTIPDLDVLKLQECPSCTSLCIPDYVKLKRKELPFGVQIAPTCQRNCDGKAKHVCNGWRERAGDTVCFV